MKRRKCTEEMNISHEDILSPHSVQGGGAPPVPTGHDLDACRGDYLKYLRDLAAGRVKPKPATTDGYADYSDLLDQEKHR